MHTRKLMLRFLTLIFVFVWPLTAQATITYVQTKCTTGYGSTTLSSGNLTSSVASGRLLIVYAVDMNNTYGDNDLTSISDTLGTSYTQIQASVNSASSAGTSLELWYGVTGSSGTNSVSTTWSRSVVNGEVCVVEVSGATIVDASENSNNASGSGGDLVSDSFSTTGSDRFVIWGVAQNGVNSFSAGSDFTVLNGTGLIGLEYRITSSTLSSYVAHITSGSGASYEGDLVAFRASGSSSSSLFWKRDYIRDNSGQIVAVATPAPFDTTAPSTPGTPSVTGVTTTSVSLSWSSSSDNGGSGLAGYIIYRGAVPVGAVPFSTTSFTDVGLLGNTTYAYRIVAFDGARNYSSYSSTTNGTTDTP